ncbi:MAG: hypothetical protein MUF64_22130 [Polyangiaceae bacterium]|jgi:sugar lactone lactonase YvrE|nr:hypothetical protein [Polyangiaceae bacterium]
MAVLGAGFLGLVPATAQAHLPPVTKVETVAVFDQSALETPEDVYVDLQGNRYVSLAMKGEVRRIAPDGQQSTYATLPLGPTGVFCSGFFAILGPITFDPQGNLYASVASCDPDNRGIWKVAPDGEQTQLARLPFESFPNGIAYRLGKVYVADSNLSLIWRVDADDCESEGAEVWVSDPLLSRKVAGQGFPGANGIQFFGDKLFTVNSDRATVVSIPFRWNGKAGKPSLYATTPVGCDDFAFDLVGNLYCASFFDQVIRVRPNGTSEVILQGGTLDGPTSIAFGRTWGDFLDIYVSSASFIGFSSQNAPKLERYRVGLPGAPIWGF